MAEFKKVAAKGDITPGSGKTVQINGKDIALFNVDGTLHAIDNTCLHMGGPLGEGGLEGSIVTCPWHGWKYDVRTGASPVQPETKVQVYEVKVEGEDVLVKAG